MDRPTLRQLEALDTIAREGSFRAAARALGVSQVAVSDHVRQLETRLGVSLFDRARGGKAQLSPAGAAALTRARLILADCDALVSIMRDFSGTGAEAGPAVERRAPASATPPEAVAEPESVVVPGAATEPEAIAPAAAAGRTPVAPPPLPRVDAPPHAEARAPSARPSAPPAPAPAQDRPIVIGTHSSILARFQDRLAAFEDAFPNRPVSVDFNCFVADRVALALSEGRISMAYFFALGATRVFPSDYLWSERWALFVARDHRLAQRDYVSRDDVKSAALVGFAAGNRLRPLLEACLDEAGLGGLSFAFESDDYGQLVERAREGAGVLPLFGAAAARIGAASGLRRLPYVDPIPAIEVRRVVHPGLARDDEAQALVATLQ